MKSAWSFFTYIKKKIFYTRKTYDNIYNIQKKQIDKLKEIYNKCLNENKTKGV